MRGKEWRELNLKKFMKGRTRGGRRREGGSKGEAVAAAVFWFEDGIYKPLF